MKSQGRTLHTLPNLKVGKSGVGWVQCTPALQNPTKHPKGNISREPKFHQLTEIDKNFREIRVNPGTSSHFGKSREAVLPKVDNWLISDLERNICPSR